jgi:hypothetical protein
MAPPVSPEPARAEQLEGATWFASVQRRSPRSHAGVASVGSHCLRSRHAPSSQWRAASQRPMTVSTVGASAPTGRRPPAYGRLAQHSKISSHDEPAGQSLSAAHARGAQTSRWLRIALSRPGGQVPSKGRIASAPAEVGAEVAEKNTREASASDRSIRGGYTAQNPRTLQWQTASGSPTGTLAALPRRPRPPKASSAGAAALGAGALTRATRVPAFWARPAAGGAGAVVGAARSPAVGAGPPRVAQVPWSAPHASQHSAPGPQRVAAGAVVGAARSQHLDPGAAAGGAGAVVGTARVPARAGPDRSASRTFRDPLRTLPSSRAPGPQRVAQVPWSAPHSSQHALGSTVLRSVARPRRSAPGASLPRPTSRGVGPASPPRPAASTHLAHTTRQLDGLVSRRSRDRSRSRCATSTRRRRPCTRSRTCRSCSSRPSRSNRWACSGTRAGGKERRERAAGGKRSIDAHGGRDMTPARAEQRCVVGRGTEPHPPGTVAGSSAVASRRQTSASAGSATLRGLPRAAADDSARPRARRCG